MNNLPPHSVGRASPYGGPVSSQVPALHMPSSSGYTLYTSTSHRIQDLSYADRPDFPGIWTEWQVWLQEDDALFSSPYYLLGGIFGKFPFLAEFHIPQSEKPVDFNRNTPTYESASLQVNAQEDFCFCKHLYFKSSFTHFYFFPLLISSQYSSVRFRIFSYKALYISLE